jgi:23S rRNA (guanosine2251-2'-O)-methyltransferase
MVKYTARELRTGEVDPQVVRSVKKNPITIILDDVLDTYNVGSIFRLADAIAAENVVLCGQTLTPPNSRIKKASINTWEWVQWQYCPSVLEAIQTYKDKYPKSSIIAVEQDARSKPFYAVTYTFPLAIIVGNESRGIAKEALDMADRIVEMPMWGINTSLNVMVSCGIILYEIMKQKEMKG